ncbi:M48 family metalloprotease [Marivibrio halodurans]|uniref:M48 family metalloprotease n=1 Tax=Marivibrio halodurans TaxID=2039722 RepID=A0A8J7S8S9_9PROT|nr:M48 family metalloprotease [Marivibrio halodurans]MBP5858969.1 M48 family metalloprotease [Marivibrio halodurans]
MATGVGVLMLAGCQTGSDTIDSMNPFADSVDISSRIVDQYLEGQGLPPDSFPAPEDRRRAPDLLPPGVGSEVAYRDHYGTISVPAMEESLNDILQRLQATLPGDPPAARVYIEPGMGFAARAERSGAIFVTFGTVLGKDGIGWEAEGLKDDHLAFLIAHEYAHILMDHFGDIETEQDMLKLAQMARVGLLARNKVDDDRDSEDLERNMRAPNIALAVSEASLLRTWGRSQEYEADLLAHDLMAAAGFNPRDSSNAIRLIKDVDDVVGRIPFFNSEEFQSIAAQTLQGGLDKGNLVSRASDAGFALFQQMSKEVFGKDHPSQNERLEQLSLYDEKQYREVTRAYVPRFVKSSDRMLRDLSTDSRFRTWEAAYTSTLKAIALSEETEYPVTETGEPAKPIFASGFARTFREARAALGRTGQEDAFLRERFAELREHEGEDETAIDNLELVVGEMGDDTPLKTLIELVNRRLDSGKIGEAGEAVRAAVLNYPDEQAWYPNKIAVELLSGDREQAQRTFDACQLQGTVTTTIACREVARGKGPGFNKNKDAAPALLESGGSVPTGGGATGGGSIQSFMQSLTGT